MISLDWKERLVSDSLDFFERKIPQGDYDFEIIYNIYPMRVDNKIPREVVILVSETLASKMQIKHREYLKFCEYLWSRKGENGKLAFATIISKFTKKDIPFYLEYAKKFLSQIENPLELSQMMDKVYYPVFKKQHMECIDFIITWMIENNDLINQNLTRIVCKIGKSNSDFLKKFTDKLENKWFNASPEFSKICGAFLKSVGKMDTELYLSYYIKYKSTREPGFVEILSSGLVLYDDVLFEMFDNWSKSGNARLKKAAMSGLKFLTKKKS
jgi:hypothetical protein